MPHITTILEQVIQHTTPTTPHISPLPKYRHPGASLHELKSRGFTVKEGYSGTWTEHEKSVTSEFMLGLLSDPDGISYFDLYTYISRKILDGSKSRAEVKKYLVSFVKQEHNTG